MSAGRDGVPEPVRWDERFAAPGYLFGTEPNAFLVRSAERFTAGQEVLVVADGEGRNGVYLAGLGLRVTAFDASEVALSKARALAADRGVPLEIEHGTLEAWDWEPDRYDAVVAIFIQFAPPELRSEAFAGMLRTVRRGGLVVIEGYTPRQLEHATGGPPIAEQLYTEEILRRAFGAHEIIELMEYDAEIHEGDGHAGMSALIDCIIRKV